MQGASGIGLLMNGLGDCWGEGACRISNIEDRRRYGSTDCISAEL